MRKREIGENISTMFVCVFNFFFFFVIINTFLSNMIFGCL